MTRPPLPPFTEATAAEKVRAAEDGWNSRDPEKVAGLPPAVRKYFRSLNTRDIDFDLPNRPDNMARQAAGISPGRWG